MNSLKLSASGLTLETYPDIPYCLVTGLMSSQLYVIAGGYPRDLYFGLTPRDIDCWVLYEPPQDGIGRGNVDMVVALLDGLGIPHEEFNMYGAEDDRSRLLVLRCPGLDIIFMETLDGLIEGFDFNINQFYMEPDVGPIYVGQSDLNAELVQLKWGDRVEKRRPRMLAKWNACVGDREPNEELRGSFYG
jgi:hypothetical protein